MHMLVQTQQQQFSKIQANLSEKRAPGTFDI